MEAPHRGDGSSESTDVKKSLDVSNNSPKQQQHEYSMIHEDVRAAAAAAASPRGSSEEELTSTLDVSGFGEKLTDEAFLELLKGFSAELTSVNVSGCRNLTDEAIKAIAQRSLRSLDASYCGKLLTDESIKVIASGCPSLESLKVADCKFLTDESLKAVAAGCGGLKTIDVSRCKQLTDESIQALAAGCPKLTSLNLRNCEKLTDEAMRAVATLNELEELRIYGCRKLTGESIENLANGPGAKQLTKLDTTNTLRQIFKKAKDMVT
jgi:F-box/leucine-rich repeat protein 2/20